MSELTNRNEHRTIEPHYATKRGNREVLEVNSKYEKTQKHVYMNVFCENNNNIVLSNDTFNTLTIYKIYTMYHQANDLPN